ncbi:chemotaxis protein CheW [Alicyclobacillus sp. SO9]|uniref:chemotaxis protein CheW n=1 Tax=Alicyclobacillus sp. SO9 TaxID=2665646 RepID=UPI0018E8486B|nr:chemotaxis protein CheW [Alicyclobacillus sp. SO9]QQE80824.1 chemotaxis protein CheW [Alicyclobacillus sp. SO9]
MSDIQVVLFTSADETYGVPVNQVQSIERLEEITPVPNTLAFVQGVVELRGEIVPVINLRIRVGAQALAKPSDDARIIVVEIAAVHVGLVVDSVLDVKTLDEESIQAPPQLIGGLEARYLSGIARTDERTLVLLNLEKILSEAQEQQLQQVERSIQGE